MNDVMNRDSPFAGSLLVSSNNMLPARSSSTFGPNPSSMHPSVVASSSLVSSVASSPPCVSVEPAVPVSATITPPITRPTAPMLAKFYHGSFEFYGPYNRGLLVDSVGYPLFSVDEWRDLLLLVNGPSIAGQMPDQLRQFRRLACLAFSLLLCGIGFILLIPLWIKARSYERAFVKYAERVKMFLDACTDGFSKRGLVFQLVRGTNPELPADLITDPYDLCISVFVN